jgi:hypothetical protein
VVCEQCLKTGGEGRFLEGLPVKPEFFGSKRKVKAQNSIYKGLVTTNDNVTYIKKQIGRKGLGGITRGLLDEIPQNVLTKTDYSAFSVFLIKRKYGTKAEKAFAKAVVDFGLYSKDEADIPRFWRLFTTNPSDAELTEYTKVLVAASKIKAKDKKGSEKAFLDALEAKARKDGKDDTLIVSTRRQLDEKNCFFKRR